MAPENVYNFSQILDMMKCGYLVTRQAWNGAGTIHLVRGSHDFNKTETLPGTIANISENLFESGDKGTITRLPHIQYSLAENVGNVVWTPTIIDLLAIDWVIVEQKSKKPDIDTEVPQN